MWFCESYTGKSDIQTDHIAAHSWAAFKYLDLMAHHTNSAVKLVDVLMTSLL